MRGRARHCRLASADATAKSRQRRGAKAGPRKIAEALHAREGKKRWVRVVVKRRMASPRPHRVDALRTETAHRGVVLAVGVATRGVAMLAVAGTVQDSATRVQAVRGQQVAHRAAVAATVATRLLVARALAAVAAAVTIATAVVVLATRAVVVATTVAAREVRVVVRAADMVVATKAVQVQARRARAGVIAVSRRLMVAVVAAPVVVMAAATPVAARAATEIAAAAVVGSQAIDGPHLLAAVLALAGALVTVTA